MDVDGVLTDAGMYYSQKGDELKKISTHDGKKKLDIGILEIQKGSRGNTAKKTIGFRVVRNTYKQFNSVTVE